MSWTQGAGFRIVGSVSREPFTREKFARLSLSVSGERETKIDVVAFDGSAIAEIGALQMGQVVQVTGNVNMEAIKDKAKNKVLVDGRERWCPMLVAKKVDVEPASKRPAKDPEPPADDDDLLF